MTSRPPREEAGETSCPQCGYSCGPDVNFCASCGHRVRPDGHPQGAIPVGEPTAELELGADLFRYPAMLVVTQGPTAGSRFELSQLRVTLGRHPDSDIFFDDVTVSRRHAEVYRDGLVQHLKDMGSLNGTYLNGRRVECAGLKNGDELQVGRFKLVYHDGTSE